MAINRVYRIREIWLLLLLFCYFPPAIADLPSEYESKAHLLEVSQFGLPIHMESSDEGGYLTTSILGRLEHSYGIVRGQIGDPKAWCGIMFLHLNTKACVHQKVGSSSTVTIYLGDKEYQPISETKPLRLSFVVKVNTSEGQVVELRTANGPYGTTDYLIVVELAPLQSCCTMVKFKLSFRMNSLIQFLADGYLNIFARKKIGFTKTGMTRAGDPIYVRGLQGVLERNVLRNYLGVTTFLDALGEDREQRLKNWFDATARYDQLKEVSRSEYLKYKQLEYEQQIAAQQELEGR